MKCKPPKKGFKYGKTDSGQRFKYWVKGKTVCTYFCLRGTRKDSV